MEKILNGIKEMWTHHPLQLIGVLLIIVFCLGVLEILLMIKKSIDQQTWELNQHTQIEEIGKDNHDRGN